MAALKKIEKRKIATQPDERVGEETGDHEEECRERDPNRDERTSAAERRPDPVRDRPDGRLDDDAFDAPRAREKTGEEVGCAEAVEDRRQDEVVERVEGAGTDGAGGIERRRAFVESGPGTHGGRLYRTIGRRSVGRPRAAPENPSSNT